jgi:hypothetical protein
MRKPLFSSVTAAAIAFVSQMAALGCAGAVSLIDQGATVYDSVLGISWLKDGNLAASNAFGLAMKPDDNSFLPGITSAGTMNATTAESWIAAMNASNYLGFNNWRMPTTLLNDQKCSGATSRGFGCTGSEMGHLFYDVFGAKVVVDPNTNNVTFFKPPQNYGPFRNLQLYVYWSATMYLPDSSNYFFTLSNGFQDDYQGAFIDMNVWPVHDGPAAVPLPSSVILFFAGAGLLGFLARRRARGLIRVALPMSEALRPQS